MIDKYLILNAGSSSLKFSLYDMPEKNKIINGYVEKIGYEDSFYSLKSNDGKIEKKVAISDHKEAVNVMIRELIHNKFINDINEIKGIGHRVLHGGEYYFDSVIIDEEVLNNIKELTKFGPLHHPGEIAGIESMMEELPDVPQVAVFDTAFHQTMPEENYMYALPYNWYEECGVRKYGFHGTSHKYITETMKTKLKKDDVNLIICHIGSGASISCIKDGICFDTSMGMTPLDGIVMGTRCGNIDASIIEYICKEKHYSIEKVNDILNKESGLLGISGRNDYRDVEKLANNGDSKAKLAIQLFKNSVVRYIADYYVKLGGDIDAIVFTAGVGENACDFRKEVINSLSKSFNIEIDENKNNNIASFKNKKSGIISTLNSKYKIYVIPTDEEYMILEDTIKNINKKKTKKYFYN